MKHCSYPYVPAIQLCALLLTALCAPVLKADDGTNALARYEYTEPQMGVPFRIVLYAAEPSQAKAASDAAFKRVADLNEIMSDYETDSELNELSRTAGQGKTVHVSQDLWTVIAQAQRLAAQSDGAFDITVGPAVTLWRRARRTQTLPEPERLAEARKAIGFNLVQLNPKEHTVELGVRGMKLDLGGIAKGHALDEALKVLASHGIARALVSGGGDMAMSGAPPGAPGWRIEIAPLDVADAPPKRFISLADAALATSGDVFQRLEIEGKRFSHIVDPRTGVGLTDHGLVTIIAPDCMTADALATAVSVLGPEKGLKLVELTPQAEAHIVRKPGERIQTRESRGFNRFSQTP